MYYYLYQITNKVNGKIYVGVHKTASLNDGYMGSGKVIRRAVMKHGIENFTKDIQEFFETEELMYAKEKEIVTEDFIKRDNVYNICVGGQGGFSFINSQQDILKKRNRKVAHNRNNINQHTSLRQTVATPKYRAIHKARMNKYYDTSGRRGFFKGQKHTEETKSKMRQPKNVGIANSQYGTFWITDGTNNTKLKISESIPTGWNKGRTI